MSTRNDIMVKQERRLCEVNGRVGYFHCWYNYSKPVPASLLQGGAPAGVISDVYGIVEFSDHVDLVNPVDIKFCDEENQMLHQIEKFKEDKMSDLK